MYYVSKRMEIAGAHSLNLPYESGCSNLHGHNWIVTVYLKSKKLTEYGMIADFKQLKQAIHGKLDHQYINDIVPFNPTAENMAKWICDTVNETIDEGICYKVTVRESEGNFATYTNDWYSSKDGED